MTNNKKKPATDPMTIPAMAPADNELEDEDELPVELPVLETRTAPLLAGGATEVVQLFQFALAICTYVGKVAPGIS